MSILLLPCLLFFLTLLSFPSPLNSLLDSDEGAQSSDLTHESAFIVDCSSQGLLSGQFLCNEVAHINPRTQQLDGNYWCDKVFIHTIKIVLLIELGCNQETELASITCQTAPGIVCQVTETLKSIF